MATASMTKFDKVGSFVRNRISQGIWKPGERIPDAEELSAELGVSDMTVKNAIAQLARDGLLHRIQKKGTFVSLEATVSNIVILAQASSLTVSRSNHYRMFLEKIIHCIEVNGYQPMLRMGYGDTPEKFLASVQFPKGLRPHEAAGVISVAGMESALEQIGIPYVSEVIAPTEYDTQVILDYNAMFGLVADIFRQRGYHDFVIMDQDRPAGEQFSAMNMELNREKLRIVNGRADRLIGFPFSPDVRFAYNAFKNYWLEGHRPRAIFFADEVVFDVASRAILELGIKVPQELAVLTQAVKGVHYHFPMPVSCVEFDAGEAAMVVWEKLQQIMIGQPMIGSVFIKPALREGMTL